MSHAVSVPAGLYDAVPLVLRRSGLRPYRFTGRLITDTEHNAAHSPWRIRLALYESESAGYVASMQCDHSVQPGVSWHNAVPCRTLEQAASVLEQACPDCCDMPPAPDAMNAQLALFYSAQLACRQAALRQEFRIAVGAFLHGLCTQGAA